MWRTIKTQKDGAERLEHPQISKVRASTDFTGNEIMR
jgi:hypothetical protein